jgi:hypothetical protein
VRSLVRPAAAILACLALALIGLRPGRSVTLQPTAALLVTPGVTEAAVRRLADSLGVARVLRLAGRDSLPDAGYVARHYGNARRLHVAGWGLDTHDWQLLGTAPAGVYPAPLPRGFTALHYSPQVTLGEDLRVAGTINGARAGATVYLSGGAGLLDSATAGPDGAFAFSVRVRAAGRERFVLEAPGVAAETLGVTIAPPPPWRVLILTAAPSFEAAAVRDLLAGQGAAVAWRAGLSRGRARTEFVNAAAFPLDRVDPGLLARHDVLIADTRAVAALRGAERAALLRAVSDSGLGVVVLADDDAGSVARELGFSLETDTAAGERLVRPRTATGRTAATPVPAASYALRDAFAAAPVVWGAAGDVLAQVAPRGAGRLVLTLVAAPSRWIRGGERAQFASYWSALLGAAASARGRERWSLDGDPAQVHRPITLTLRAPSSRAAAVVVAPSGARDTLYPAADPLDPHRFLGRFWPRETGWHAIDGADERAAFYVAGAAAWPALRAAERRAATARWAAGTPTAGPEGSPVTARRPLPPGWWLALFLLAAGVLWAQRRRAYIRAMPRTAVVAVLLVVLACAKSDEDRREEVAACSAVNTQADLIAVCLSTEHDWDDAKADSAGKARQAELDAERQRQDDSLWNASGSQHQAAVRECGRAPDLRECLLLRYGWPEARATRTADSLWMRNADAHAREVRACVRGRNPVASCLMLNYKWNAQRAFAAEDSLRRAHVR